MRRRDRPVDILRKMRVIRTVKELAADEELRYKSSPMIVSSHSSSAASVDMVTLQVPDKKKLNIPIGDVLIDPEYDTYVTPTYQLPTNYVRYNKKIGDEPDLIVDYLCDQTDIEWITSRLPALEKYDCQSYLTVETVDFVINALEKATGHGDIAPLVSVEKSILQGLNIPHLAYSKIVPEIYQYWISKRTKLHKPCSRKYWPQTSPTDTNPHLVFRPREKERYRLRKHRKNDLDSYRKMQQLRRDFGQVRIILQLIIERERLKRAELEVHSRVLEQAVCESHPSIGAIRKQASSELYTYKPQYMHLTQKPVEAVAVTKSSSSKKRSSQSVKAEEIFNFTSSATGLKLTLKVNRPSQNAGEVCAEGDASVVGAAAAVDSARKKNAAGEPKKKKKKKERPAELPAGSVEVDEKNAVETGQPQNAAISALDSDIMLLTGADPAIFASSLLTGDALYQANCARLAALGVPGPQVFLSPQWPTFMNDLTTREKTFIPRTIAEYAAELELQSDEPLPTKFRCRGRVGRGGRVVIDRIPVYEHDTDYGYAETRGGSTRATFHGAASGISYFFPTTLPSVLDQIRFTQASRDCRRTGNSQIGEEHLYISLPVQDQGVTSTSRFGEKQLRNSFAGEKQPRGTSETSVGGLRGSSSSGTFSTKNNDIYQAHSHPIREMGLVIPPPRLIQPSELSRRQTEICRVMDTDEEIVEIPRTTIFEDKDLYTPPFVTPLIRDIVKSKTSALYLMRI